MRARSRSDEGPPVSAWSGTHLVPTASLVAEEIEVDVLRIINPAVTTPLLPALPARLDHCSRHTDVGHTGQAVASHGPYGSETDTAAGASQSARKRGPL